MQGPEERRPPVAPWTVIRRFLAARFDTKSQLGFGLTSSLAVLVAGLWAFSGLLEEVLDDELLVRADRAVELWFRGHASEAGLRFFSGVTLLGSTVAVVAVVLVAVYLWRHRETLLLWAWLGANVGGKLVEYTLKATVHRSRPEYAAAYLHGQSYSFPSGHTMGATVCYFTLAYLLAAGRSWDRVQRAVAFGFAGLLVFAVALSSVYLGVHYPSDVIGGFTAGIAWVAACVASLRYARARHDLRARPAT